MRLKINSKHFSFILVLMLNLCLFTAGASAANVVADGYCGDEGNESNIIWALDDAGLLTISGKGEMRNYSSDSE